MNTPIYDFLTAYRDKGFSRMHMPGHKGASFLGGESLDLTEVSGADSLYEADGIILESERNAGELFGAKTYYSTGGSSLSIRAMLYLARVNSTGVRLIAGRNAHKSLVQSAALLGLEIDWLYGEGDGYLSRVIDASEVESAIRRGNKPVAVYITSPDYLGRSSDISEIADVCHTHGIPLLVDNAHGAYLKFLDKSRHPIDLGADMCADSAHKTLPALTGASYLHVAPDDKFGFSKRVREALSLFGSTSPSYLIMASLDLTNGYIADGYRERLSAFIKKLDVIRLKLREKGYNLIDTTDTDPLKITVKASELGISGVSLGEILRLGGVECEFSDRDNLVLMLTPENTDSELERLADILLSVERRVPLIRHVAENFKPTVKMSIRDAVMSKSVNLPVCEAKGRVLATASVPCPPAVPILVPGEVVDERAISLYSYYGIETLSVVE